MISKALRCVLAVSILLSASLGLGKGQQPGTGNSTKVAGTQQRIANLVQKYQPAKGAKYAQKVAYVLCKASSEHRIDPMIPTAVAIVESRFQMHSRPQLGIFQFTRSTWRKLYAVRGWNAMNLEHNISAGVDYVARHYYSNTVRNARGYYWSAASRGHSVLPAPTESRLRQTFARYNGCGKNASYVNKVLKVYRSLVVTPKDRNKR